MMKRLGFVGIALLMAGVSHGAVLATGSSAKFMIDTRAGKGQILMDGATMLRHSSLWNGDAAATVTLAQDGVAFAEGLTGEGAFAWRMPGRDTYTLTHTTYTNGVKGAVLTAAFCTWKHIVNADRTATLTEVVSAKGDVEIPEEIGGCRVTALGDSLFAGCAEMTGVTIPAGVTSIGANVFSGCIGLTSVTMPDSVTNIANSAFSGCSGLTSVMISRYVCSWTMSDIFPDAYSTITNIVISDSETSIADNAFSGCIGLTGVTIPAGVTVLPDGLFDGCDALASVTLPDTLEDFGDNDLRAVGTRGGRSGLWVQDGWVLGYLGEAPATVEIPDGVKGIAAHAFADQSGLESVVFPDTLEYVGVDAFRLCTGLARIDLPAGVVRVDDGAFRDCTYVQTLVAPDTLRRIGASAFANAQSLEKVAFADGLLEVGPAAFSNAWRMLSVSLPVSVTNVGAAAFANCSAVRRVTMPGGVVPVQTAFPAAFAQLLEVSVTPGTTRIVDGFFAGCASLTEVGLPVGVAALGTGAFRNCAALLKATLPEGLSELPDETFAGCASLPSLVVPASVARLGSRVFAGCTALRSVQFLGNAPAADAAAYADAPAALVTYVADGTRGWDGIETSRNLPETWPAGAANAIATWTPTRLAVTFDARGGEPAVTSLVETVGTTYRLPQPDPVRLGATFLGWWTETDAGAEVRPTTRVVLTGDHTLYAHWRLHGYTVAFDANGGVGTMASVARTVGAAASLPSVAFRRVGHDFAGWALARDGAVAFTDGADPGDLAYDDGAAVTLYAVWRERVWTAEDWLDAAGLAFSCTGDADWRPDGTESHDGVGSMRSGVLGTAPEGTTVRSTLKASVRGQGVLSFWWKVVCEPSDPMTGDLYDYLELTVDGTRPASVAPIAGETGWTRVEVRLTGTGTHEVAWSFVKDDWDEAVCADAAWVDEVSWTPDAVTLAFDGNGATDGTAPDRISASSGEGIVLPGPGTLVRNGFRFAGWSDGERTYAAGETYVTGGADVTFDAVWKELSVSDALDATNLVFTAGGDADWVIDSAVSHDGAAALRSGAVSAEETCWVETSVEGAGTLAFWWKADGLVHRGRQANYVEVTVDGAAAESVAVTNWTFVTVPVAGGGAHTVRWTYRQTRTQTEGKACAWIDEVTWTPAPSQPTVEGDADATVTGDAEAGYIVTPSATNRNVEVTIPDGVPAAKVTVVVGPDVATVRPNGANVVVKSYGYDITAFLDIPAAVGGVVNLASATVKAVYANEPLDVKEGAVINLGNPSNPSLTTAQTREGLVYTLREGVTLDEMNDGDSTVGDGRPWTPNLTVKGGASGFYSIRVDK